MASTYNTLYVMKIYNSSKRFVAFLPEHVIAVGNEKSSQYPT